MPPTNGNISAAASTPARRQQPANLLTVPRIGRPSDMHPGYPQPRSNSVHWQKHGAARVALHCVDMQAPNALSLKDG